MTRIETAMKRIENVRATPSPASDDAAGSAKVMELVNTHERLREEVSETIRELDSVIRELEQ